MSTLSQKTRRKSAARPGKIDFLKPDQAVKRYHFVGIGGCGMSALAEMLTQRGHTISGSDRNMSAVTRRLENQGIRVYPDHQKQHVNHHLDALVISAAIKNDNPELQAAHQRGVRVYKYAELLGELTSQIATLAVAGTHGKSTTSGWLSFTLSQAGFDPGFVIGADVPQLGSASHAGGGNLLVVEACEFDRSFLNFRPACAAILNIEQDHLDYYRDLEEIVEAFSDFTRTLPEYGLLVANGDDVHIRKMLQTFGGRVELFSIRDRADWWSDDLHFDGGHGCFSLMYGKENLGSVRLSLPGRHNVSNALAVAALAKHAGLNNEQIKAGLETFGGVGRRMDFKGRVSGITILDDYAHHPTEIRVTLEAIAAKYRPKRLWCVFQPHQHSRTRFLLDEFAASFQAADQILLPEIYFVRDSETCRKTVNASQLEEKITARGGNCNFLGDFDAILAKLLDELDENDLVVTMGAGDVWKIADELVRQLG